MASATEPQQTMFEGVSEPSEPSEALPPAEEASLTRLLEHVTANLTEPAAPVPALRTARVASVRGKAAQIVWRGRSRAEVAATLDEGVHTELVARAMASGDAVLVEMDPEVGPVIVGVVQTRMPDELQIKARKIVIEADEELVMRAGRGALRLREDGDVELVGSRISTLSRGLFRIVGRVLRLN